MRQDIVGFFNAIIVTWLASWAGIIGLLVSFWLAFGADGAENRFRACFREAKTDLLLAHAVKICYIVPNKVFGRNILSIKSVARSVFCSIIAFLFCLSIAYVTSPTKPPGANPVINYLSSLQSGMTFRLVLPDFDPDVSNAVKVPVSKWRPYYPLVLGWLFTLIFEFICLVKSRIALKKIRVGMKSLHVMRILGLDVALTVILFVVYYAIVSSAVNVFMYLTYDDVPFFRQSLVSMLSPPRQPSQVEPFQTLEPSSLAEWADTISFYVVADCAQISRAIIEEVMSGFSDFIVINRTLKTYIVIGGARYLYRKGGEYYPVQYEGYADIPTFSIPLSLVLGSALLTSVWIAIVVVAIVFTRVVCRISSRWRAMIIRCCRSPHIMWNRLIMPSLVVCVGGTILLIGIFVSGL